MKKKKLATLAIIGISMGILVEGHAQGQIEQMSSDMKKFYEQLAPDTQKKFLELDASHRKSAMQSTAQYCKGENQCPGYPEQAVEEQYNNQTQQRNQTNQGIKNS